MAALAPTVLAACAEVPELGERLLMTAGAALADIVSATARSLGWSRGMLPLVAAGGFLLSATIVFQAMIDRLSRQATQVTDPVRGAIILAERAAGALP
jgi:N-acetylglucosamine kinase-like BadF-type ATPase